MDVARLRMLRELADHGTVTAAADVLGLTPSAISQQLKILQREAGVALLEPAGRGVRLTDAGAALVRHADTVLGALQRARADMDAYRVAPRGTVRVSMFPSGAAMLLAQTITACRQHGVDVIGRDIDLPASAAPQQLTEFDIVVVHRNDRDTDPWPPRFQARILAREPLDVLMPAAHALAGADKVALQDLADESWIGVTGGLMLDDVLNSIATLTGMTPRIMQRVNDFRVVEELVQAELGVALMPRYVTTTRALVRMPISDIRVARRIEAVTRAGTTLPSVALVVDQLYSIAHRIAASAR